ncbi:MAG: type III-B CRISPR module RAMP protein Cmr6 [Desulfurococcales archaeon]|nr:type III-B CRISPR module RAMP protein Cmr6 [Desulfurococcales archaeon]
MNNKIVGGRLLKAINKALKESIEENKANNTWDNLKLAIKNNLLKRLVLEDSKEWRVYLPTSLSLAKRLLETTSIGLRGLYDSVFSLYFYLTDYGLVGSAEGILNTIFEAGLFIDWLLGLPFYPGSSIKGGIRDVAENFINDREVIEELFGSSGEAGSIGGLFISDAYPIGCKNDSKHPCLILTGDVVNPHYYKPGLGWVETEMDVEPSPVKHIAIAPGTVFRVVIGVMFPTEDKLHRIVNEVDSVKSLLGSSELELDDYMKYLKLISNLVASAFYNGIGARSSKGYNMFEYLDDKNAVNSTTIHYLRIRKVGNEEHPRIQRRGRHRGGIRRSPGYRRRFY